MFTPLKTLGDFCAQMGRNQCKPQQKWVHDMLFGILSSRTLMLSEIGRALNEPTRLIHTEKRLSRNLNSDRLDDEALLQQHLELVAEATMNDDGEGVVIAVDYTDLNKPYANLYTGMELVCNCRDGSQGKISIGYPVVQLEAHLPNGTQRPLLYRVYSTRDPSFRSEAWEFITTIKKATPYVGPRAWWVFDRGFDSKRIFHALDDLSLRWTIRLKIGNNKRCRHLVDTSTGQTVNVRDLALGTKLRWHINRTHGKGINRRYRTIAVGARPVQLPGEKAVRTLVAVQFSEKTDPMVLLVGEALDSRETILEIVQVYFRRWKAEEANRAMKESRGWGVRMEDLRALTFRGVQRLVLLACMTYGFLAELQAKATHVVQAAISKVKSFGKALDIRYQLIRGFGKMLGRISLEARVKWRMGTAMKHSRTGDYGSCLGD